jgi:hypothetical protein
MLKINLNNDYEKIDNNEEGLKNLKLGKYTKYSYFHKFINAGFLIKIKYPPLIYLKNQTMLVFKNNNKIYEIPFYKYTFYQQKNKSYFSNKEERNEILKNTKRLLDKIII